MECSFYVCSECFINSNLILLTTLWVIPISQMSNWGTERLSTLFKVMQWQVTSWGSNLDSRVQTPPSIASPVSHLFIRSLTGPYHMLSPPRCCLRAADVAASKSAEQADGGVAGSDVTVSWTCFEKYGQLHKFRDDWILTASFLFRV